MLKEYSRYHQLPAGTAPGTITEGCLVLEGGGWRGLYTQGALDALMEAGICFQTTVGVSAGAMSALSYLSGQIGLSARINLRYRHDPKYCGAGAFLKDFGVTGFSYFFDRLLPSENFNWDRFFDSSRRLVVAVTNVYTGQTEYLEKGKTDIKEAIRASATVPYLSLPVWIDDEAYLDGGCSEKIPYTWTRKEKMKKIVVIRTRHKAFRASDKSSAMPGRLLYMGYSKLRTSLSLAGMHYNEMALELLREEHAGRIFMQAPRDPVTVSRFEGDMEKLGALYFRGYEEMKENMESLKAYLEE